MDHTSAERRAPGIFLLLAFFTMFLESLKTDITIHSEIAICELFVGSIRIYCIHFSKKVGNYTERGKVKFS